MNNDGNKTSKYWIIIILLDMMISGMLLSVLNKTKLKEGTIVTVFFFTFLGGLALSYFFVESILHTTKSKETDKSASTEAKQPTKHTEEIPVWAKNAFDRWNSSQKDITMQDQNRPLVPVTIDGQAVHVNLAVYSVYYIENSKRSEPTLYQYFGLIPLTEKEPIISLYEDGELRWNYRLQTEGDEDFTGKYFQIGVNLYVQGDPAVPVCQIDGFISDTPEKREMKKDDIAYRMEVCFLGNGYDSQKRYEENRGKDLGWKALKYARQVTPSNVRLVGICPKCKQSFAFHSYAVYLTQDDAAYSDDGLDVCAISDPNIDQATWMYEIDGKTFRYYNSFCCPHCGEPYIDYKKQPENKKFGVSACVHLGHQLYRAGYVDGKQLSEQERKPEEMADTGSVNASDSAELNDLSYIKKMDHQQNGPWHQYSILIDARPAGWGTIIDWADYMAEADLDKIATVTYSSLGAEEKEIVDQFEKYNKMANIPELQDERSSLAIGGVSRVLNCPVKIVWFNQTKVMKVFTWVDDDKMMERYVETVIRRTFGTADAMKSAKPHKA